MKLSDNKGFSVLELIVSLGIFVFLTAVLLLNYNSINRRLSLDMLAHQTAQWVRETQVSAMSVRSHSGGFGNRGFGLHFAVNDPGQFIYFADIPPNPNTPADHRYQALAVGGACGDVGEECVKVVSLLQGNKVSRICGTTPTPTYTGSCPVGFDELTNADIVFTRPDPDASINGDVVGTPTEYGDVIITVRSVTGYERSINVWTTGQVTVQ